MNETEQRIAIAEACGWKQIVTTEEVMHWPGGMLPTEVTRWSRHVIELAGKKVAACVHEEEEELPDYLHDLNAMHEAEKVLTEPQRLAYMRILIQPESIDDAFHVTNGMAWDMTHASAAQRAEAFLRTIGKWKDSPP
jgi:hypothetical protein